MKFPVIRAGQAFSQNRSCNYCLCFCILIQLNTSVTLCTWEDFSLRLTSDDHYMHDTNEY